MGLSQHIVEPGNKWCYACATEKPVAAFSKDKSRRDGLQPRCKTCTEIYRVANIDRIRTTKRAAYDKRMAEKGYYVPLSPEEKRRRHREDMRIRQGYPRPKRQRQSEDVRKAKAAAWREKNKADLADYGKKRRAGNPAYFAAQAAFRKAAKRRATPKWADQASMRAFYELIPLVNEETGVKHNVDHIVPLISKIVCGLHCEANLRVITAAENAQKSNVIWPDMPDPTP